MEDGRERFRLHKYNMNSVQHNGAVFGSALLRRGEQTCSPQEYHAQIPGECERDTHASYDPGSELRLSVSEEARCRFSAWKSWREPSSGPPKDTAAFTWQIFP